MYVCICKGITDKQIEEVIQNGACTLNEIRKILPVAKSCCKCVPKIKEMISDDNFKKD